MSYYNSPTLRYQDLTSRRSLDTIKPFSTPYTKSSQDHLSPTSATANLLSNIASRLNPSTSLSSLYQHKPSSTYRSELENKSPHQLDFDRLSNINSILRRENDALREEISRLKNSSYGSYSKTPELENQIMRLTSRLKDCEEGLRQKEQQIEDKDRRIFELRRSIDGYSSMDRSNLSLASNNKNLLSEIDKLYALLRNTTKEFDHIKSDNERLLALPSLVRELTKRIELLDSELIDKSRGMHSQKNKLDDLWSRLEELDKEKERATRDADTYEKEVDLWKTKLEVEEKRHDELIEELRRELAVRQKISAEEVRGEFMREFEEERDNLESHVADVNKKLKEYEGKILMLSAEVERLNDSIADKTEQLNEKLSENDELRQEIINYQRDLEEFRVSKDAKNKIIAENARDEVTASFALERKTLEDEIRRLRLDLKEIGRLEKAAEIKDKEIEDLNKLVRELDERNEKRVNELNQHWEGKTKLAVERDVRELGAKFVLEKANLEHELKNAKLINQNLEEKLDLQHEEIKRLSSWNESKSQEIINLREENTRKELVCQKEVLELKRAHHEELRREVGNVEENIQNETNKEIDRLQKKNDNLESKILALADELSKMANTNEDQFAELERLRIKLRSQEQRHETDLKELRANLELESKLKTERDLSELRASTDREITSLDSKYKANEQAKRTLEAKYEFLEEDRAKLSEEIKTLHKQVFDLRQKYRDLENSRDDELENLRKQFETYRQAGAELDQYRGRYEDLFKDMSYYREKVSEVESEKSKEIQNLKKDLIELENRSYKEKKNFENQLEGERRASLDLRESHIRFGNEKTDYENKLRQLKSVNDNGRIEMEKLYDLLNHRKREHESYLKQNEELRRQVDKLQKQVKTFEGADEPSVREWQKSNDLLERIEELEKENTFFKEQTDLYAEQLQIKKEELEEKIQEIEDMKEVYEVSIQKIGAEFL